MQFKQAAFSIAAGTGASAIVAAVSGKRIRVRSLVVTFGAATTVKFQNGTTDVSGLLAVAANGQLVLQPDPEGWFPDSGINEAFNVNRTGSCAVAGMLTYYEE